MGTAEGYRTLALTFLGAAVAALLTVSAQGPPSISPAPAPSGTESQRVEWMTITSADAGSFMAAVARPTGAGPFPTIVLLHGSHGFAREYVDLARALSLEGVLAIAPCWFTGAEGPGVRFVTPIRSCPDAPGRPEAESQVARKTIDTLLQAVRTLPGVRGDRVALYGHSRGGGAALQYALHAGEVQALVLNSAGYPAPLRERVKDVNVPLLILHGVADGTDDGGTAMTHVRMAQAFEKAMRSAGKPVESRYFETGNHNSIFTTAAQNDETVRLVAAFIRRHLGR